MGLVILEVNEENLNEHRNQLPTGLDYNAVHEHLNDCYFWNSWDEFTKENIKHDFRTMYPGDYDISNLELIEDDNGLPWSKFKIHINYRNEIDQVVHLLRWM